MKHKPRKGIANMQNLRIQKRSDGVFLVCDRGQVAKMTAGYGPTQEEDAACIVRACANHAALLEALKELAASIDLSRLNVRKDFHLLASHASALKAINNAEGGTL